MSLRQPPQTVSSKTKFRKTLKLTHRTLSLFLIFREYKEYFEVKLGGGHPNQGLEKYLQNDRLVLSFNIAWDDQTLEGQVNYYVLNYFLADDTLEIKEKVV